MKTKVFIDGSEGTTGLRIHERFQSRDDIELLKIAPELRKDKDERKRLINASDVTFLCLPDAAAREAVELVENENVKIIDSSTAHRTEAGWNYGFPELSTQHRENIVNGKRIAVPGCHATGFVSMVYPLVTAGILTTDFPISSFSLTGYSGGGKKMIGQYEDPEKEVALNAPRQYGLGQKHKHLPEVVHTCGLATSPIFSPIVDDYYAGMEVTIGFHTSHLNNNPTAKDIHDALLAKYKDSQMVNVAPFDLDATNGLFLAANENTDLDTMTLYVSGNDDRVMVHAIFDNLGKGASGAAVQCMNIALGFPEETGLAVK